MYRTATKRLLLLRAPSGSNINIKARLRFPFLLHPHHQNIDNNTCRFSSTSEIPQSSPNQTFNPNPNQHSASNHSDPTSTSTAEEAGPQETQRKRRYVEYQDEQARVLQASLPHVVCTTLFLFMPTMCLINCQREHNELLLRLKNAHFVIAGEVGMDWSGYDCWCQGSWCFSFYHWFFPKERSCTRRATFLHQFSINLTFVFPTQLYSGC